MDLNVELTGIASVMEKQAAHSKQYTFSLDVLLAGRLYISAIKNFRSYTPMPGLSDQARAHFTISGSNLLTWEPTVHVQ